MTQFQNLIPSLSIPQGDNFIKESDKSNSMLQDMVSSASVTDPIALLGSLSISASQQRAFGQQSNSLGEKNNQINIEVAVPAQITVDNSKIFQQVAPLIEQAKINVERSQSIQLSPGNQKNPDNKQAQIIEQPIKMSLPINQDEQCRLFINQKSKQQTSTPDKNQKEQVQFEEVIITEEPQTIPSKPLTELLIEKKQRLDDRYKKSQKIRATIIKLAPIATKKDSDIKIALNNIKMKQTVQFLQSKGSQNLQQKIPASQWRQQKQPKQQRIKNLIKNNSPPNKQSPSIPKFTSISPSKSKQQKSPSKQKKSPSLPKLQSKSPIQRVMPYNIYNLYQRKPEMFKLTSLPTP